MADLKNKRVITAAVCGSWPTKDMNPAVPYSPQEIAREAYECWQAGAAHLRRMPNRFYTPSLRAGSTSGLKPATWRTPRPCAASSTVSA